MFRASATLLCAVGNGPTHLSGGQCTDDGYHPAVYGVNERGVRSSSMFAESNTAVYDNHIAWTYLQTAKVCVERMPAPEAKYYKVHTRRPWDISSQEYFELTTRRHFIKCVYFAIMFFLIYFYLPKEKTFIGTRGTDGFWVMLPKNQPHQF